MGRRRLAMRKIENHTRRQITYSKRREGIIKKATELSVLCDTDVGVLMFSPIGRLTIFASGGRIEDIFLRYTDQADKLREDEENEESLSVTLKHLKYQGETLEKIVKIEALEGELDELNKQQHEAQEKIRCYNLDPAKITSICEANLRQLLLMDAIRDMEKLKAKWLDSMVTSSRAENESVKIHTVEEKEMNLTREECVNSKKKRNPSRDEYEPKSLPAGPHLSIRYLETQRHWNLQSGEQSTHQG